MGIHIIERFVKRSTSQVGEVAKYTPYSSRAINATRLFVEGLPEQLIQEHTGHSSLAVGTYKRTSAQLKENVSKVLQKQTLLRPTLNFLALDSSEPVPTTSKHSSPTTTTDQPFPKVDVQVDGSNVSIKINF